MRAVIFVSNSDIEIAQVGRYNDRIDDVSIVIATTNLSTPIDLYEGKYMLLSSPYPIVFWVYVGTTTQTIDFTQKITDYKKLDVYLYTDPPTATKNISKLIDNFAYQMPIVSNEEQRFLCRYDDFVAGDEDNEICPLNKKLGVTNAKPL